MALERGYTMNELITKEEINIENMIYEIRGKQVMLDSDLAFLYGCSNGTKSINLAVRRHINRFPERFMFQLTEEESKNIWFQIETKYGKKETRGGKYNKPYVFTEQGVAMLATVLRTKVAEEISIKIMDAFVAMRKYISNDLINKSYYEDMLIRHDTEIKLLQESFDKLESKRKDNEIYFSGQIYDAYSKIVDIFKKAKEELIIIDSYADKIVLDIISNLKIPVTLICKSKTLLTKLDIEKYNMQYSNLKIIYDDTFHDRYFILDNIKVYHCGASINRIGYKTFSITLMNDKDVIKPLLNKVNNIKKNHK